MDLSELSPSLWQVYQNLPAEKQQQFQYEYQKVKKDPKTAFWLVLLFGCHYLYLGQVGKQILYWITIGGLSIWAWIDLFTIQKKVMQMNEENAEKILLKLK